MPSSEPPPLPTVASGRSPWIRRGALALLIIVGLVPLTLRVTGLLRPTKVPTGAMAPAVSPGDHLFMEGITYLFRKPRRGDIIIFESSHVPSVPNALYIFRCVGQPGETLRLMNGKLYVNGQHQPTSNSKGEIVYLHAGSSRTLRTSNDVVNVPAGHYFVIGDNSLRSADSRYWGFVPASNILGRAAVCYWPPARVGAIK